jgi:hypothetical protein
MPNFRVFDKRAVPASGDPMITFQRAGSISLNKAAYQAIGEPSYVELLYDPDERIVGFHALIEKLPHAYPVRVQGQAASPSHTYLVAGLAFMKYYDILPEVSTRYMGEMYDEVLGVDLKKKGLEVTSNRNRRKLRAVSG